jgi:large subunit ribosomal protein L28e
LILSRWTVEVTYRLLRAKAPGKDATSHETPTCCIKFGQVFLASFTHFNPHLKTFTMVAIPDQLVWELTKRNNAFLKKKNGHTKRSGAIQFSVEKGNLKSLNQLKYSGIANTKVTDIVFTKKDGAELVTKSASKCHTKPNKAMTSANISKDFRRSESIIVKQTVDNFYRRDLKAAALAKYTKVYQANRRAKGITKTVPIKKGRGNHKAE